MRLRHAPVGLFFFVGRLNFSVKHFWLRLVFNCLFSWWSIIWQLNIVRTQELQLYTVLLRTRHPLKIHEALLHFCRVHIHQAEMQIVCKSQNACWFFRQGKKWKQQQGEREEAEKKLTGFASSQNCLTEQLKLLTWITGPIAYYNIITKHRQKNVRRWQQYTFCLRIS